MLFSLNENKKKELQKYLITRIRLRLKIKSAMLKNTLIILTFLFFGNSIFSQNITDLKILFDKLEFSQKDISKDSINEIISNKIEKMISENNLSELKEIKNVSVLVSEDKKVSIVTWPVLYSDFTFKYFGYIRYYESDYGRYSTEKLSDNSKNIVNPERQILSPGNWYGAFYYKMIYKKYKKNKIYVLLGWNGNDDLTDKKIIDVFYSDENQEPVFGKMIFESENGIKNRCIFEYKEGISMNLRYDEKKEVIIWDHLSPSSPELKGHYEYYGPDLTFDALYFEKGIWKYIADYDIRK